MIEGGYPSYILSDLTEPDKKLTPSPCHLEIRSLQRFLLNR